MTALPVCLPLSPLAQSLVVYTFPESSPLPSPALQRSVCPAMGFVGCSKLRSSLSSESEGTWARDGSDDAGQTGKKRDFNECYKTRRFIEMEPQGFPAKQVYLLL